MKNAKIIISLLCIFFFTTSTFAQFDIDLEKKIEKKINKELNDAADDAIDETAETVKKGGSTGEEETTGNDNNTSPEINTQDTDVTQSTVESEPVEELKLWSNYDFVAGEKVIFEDDLSGEESGEFPSRWDLLSGSAEVASLGGENVIHLNHHNSIILPLMDKQDFLTEVFTIEFDVFFEQDGATRSDIYRIRLFEGTSNSKKIDGKNIGSIDITWNNVKMGQFGGKISSFNEQKKELEAKVETHCYCIQ